MGQSSPPPSNEELERLLIQAASDPGARPAFYKKLLESTLFVLVPKGPPNPRKGVLTEDSTFQIMTWGNVVPFFSSLERLNEGLPSEYRGIGYLGIPGKVLFSELAKGDGSAVLNPRCAHGKEFIPEEIRRLADGSLFSLPPAEVVQTPRQVLLAQPANYPTKLVGALQSLFAAHPEVEATYLALISDPASGYKPHIIIGIAGQGDMQPVIKEAGFVAGETVGKDEMVAFIALSAGSCRKSAGQIESYLVNDTKPFYEKAPAKPWWKPW